MDSQASIAVFGMGHVGLVTAVCLADFGYRVVCYDTDNARLEQIRSGVSPIEEPGVPERLQAHVKSQRILVAENEREAILSCDVLLISVGTTASQSGSLSLDAVTAVLHKVSEVSEQRDCRLEIILRSTVFPGAIDRHLLPIISFCDTMNSAVNLSLHYVPEFLREGSSISDFLSPPFTVIGSNTGVPGEIVTRMFARIGGPVCYVSCKEAELIKLACNAFHATKVCFANEIGRIADAQGIDAARVMDIFCLDRQLNLSPAYLKPGAPYGGPCLNKDLQALTHVAEESSVKTELLKAALTSNEEHIDHIIRKVQRLPVKRIGMVGLSFKPHTGDYRNSPLVTISQRLLEAGYDLRIYERSLSSLESSSAPLSDSPESDELCRLEGLADLQSSLCHSMEELEDHAELILVGHSIHEDVVDVESISNRERILYF
jgi:GDP-mannose 6-dehydrogenase